jgi:hypothetical protein
MSAANSDTNHNTQEFNVLLVVRVLCSGIEIHGRFGRKHHLNLQGGNISEAGNELEVSMIWLQFMFQKLEYLVRIQIPT